MEGSLCGTNFEKINEHSENETYITEMTTYQSPIKRHDDKSEKCFVMTGRIVLRHKCHDWNLLNYMSAAEKVVSKLLKTAS